MVAQIRVTKTGVGIGLCSFGEQAGAKAPILLAGREAKGLKAALEQAMREAGLAQGDWGAGLEMYARWPYSRWTASQLAENRHFRGAQ